MLKDNLIMLRNVHGFSQEEIAGEIGISRQAYAKWESGATVPDIEKCKRLADIYGVTIDSLITTETIDGRITDQGSSLPANASAARSLLCFDIDCDAWLEFHGEAVAKAVVFSMSFLQFFQPGLDAVRR